MFFIINFKYNLYVESKKNSNNSKRKVKPIKAESRKAVAQGWLWVGRGEVSKRLVKAYIFSAIRSIRSEDLSKIW